MKNTAIPALGIPDFNAAGINLATLGLNPTNPAADRVKLGLQALRSTPIKATKSPVHIKQTLPGLNIADAKALGEAISNSQFSQGIGVDGKKVALEVAVRLADVLDVYHAYRDLMASVPLDLSNVESYVDPRCWAATPPQCKNLVRMTAEAAHKGSLKDIDREIASLTSMLDQLDRIGGTALELFERRRMQREGLRPTAINKAIAQMKADGRIPAAKEGGSVA
jgi:hypothetical protein